MSSEASGPAGPISISESPTRLLSPPPIAGRTWLASAAVLTALIAAALWWGWQFPRALPTVNAGLNSLSTVLLLVGYVLIKQGRVVAHRNVMLIAFAVSMLFLTCYLVYHASVGHVGFQHTGPIRTVYLAILLTHIVLAVAVPPLAIASIYLGLRDRRAAHRRVSKWAFPIWLYVSITGVVIYLLQYHLPPPA